MITANQQITFEKYVTLVNATVYPTKTRQWVITHLVEKGHTPDSI